MSRKTLYVVTGMSGAGKTQVIRCLEDAGFYCVEHLPLDLFPKFMDLLDGSAGELGSLAALGLDLRETALETKFPQIYAALMASPHNVHIIFVDASDDVLLRRFSETRRPHPLSPKGTVEEGIALERSKLAQIREKADWVLETSGLNIHQLRAKVRDGIASIAERSGLTVNIVSFGFAYGLPPEASLVFDVRFLPNPFFVPELRPLTGEDGAVYRYVTEGEEGAAFLDNLASFLGFLLPRFQREGKAYLTIAIGCTGGRHRSVAVAEWLYNTLRERKEITVGLVHRDKQR